MKIGKADRARVLAMFGGKCAYCGVELGSRWHVDHIEPVLRGVGAAVHGKPAHYMERHRTDNLFPACASCNIDKGQQSIESFRGWIETHLRQLRRKSTYNSVVRYGLVQETGAPVVFYFERVRAKASEQTQ